MKRPPVFTTSQIIPFILLLGGLLLAACAGSNPGNSCDPSQTVCACDAPGDCPAGWRCDGVSCVSDDDGGKSPTTSMTAVRTATWMAT
jgi:hypothetical protein